MKKNITNPETLKLTDSISKTFCGAKWKQFTLNLHNGESANCCLSKFHTIRKDELQKKFLSLFNHPEDLKDRELMLKGVQNDSCAFCWRQEKESPLESDRIYKSSAYWAYPHYQEIKKNQNVYESKPSYLEISFSSKCNLKCLYCNPQTSSSIYAENSKFGPYPDIKLTGDLDYVDKHYSLYQNEEDNIYIKALEENLDLLLPHVEVFRFTGGEPLLSENIFPFISRIYADKQRPKHIEINSNLSASSHRIEKLIELINKKPEHISYSITTSLDTWGEQAEYIRSGLILADFKKNVSLIIDHCPQVPITFTVTFNLFSLFNFSNFLDYILELRSESKHEIHFMIYPIVNPPIFSLDILPHDFKQQYLEKTLSELETKKIIKDGQTFCFSDFEIESFKRILSLKNRFSDEKREEIKQDFYYYMQESDFRKKTSLRDTFPELNFFLDDCEKSVQNFFHENKSSVDLRMITRVLKRALYPRVQPFLSKEDFQQILLRYIDLADNKKTWELYTIFKNAKNEEFKAYFQIKSYQEISDNFRLDQITETDKIIAEVFSKEFTSFFRPVIQSIQSFQSLTRNQKHFLIDLNYRTKFFDIQESNDPQGLWAFRFLFKVRYFDSTSEKSIKALVDFLRIATEDDMWILAGEYSRQENSQFIQFLFDELINLSEGSFAQEQKDYEKLFTLTRVFSQEFVPCFQQIQSRIFANLSNLNEKLKHIISYNNFISGVYNQEVRAIIKQKRFDNNEIFGLLKLETSDDYQLLLDQFGKEVAFPSVLSRYIHSPVHDKGLETIISEQTQKVDLPIIMQFLKEAQTNQLVESYKKSFLIKLSFKLK